MPRYAVESDPVAAWAHWRDVRDHLFRSHPQSPVPAAERGDATTPDYFDYDPALRTVADLEAADGATFELPGRRPGTSPAERAGTAHCMLLGERLSLSMFWLLDYSGGFFLSFRDGTSGTETYGAGRYLLDTAKGADLGMDGSGQPGPRLQLLVPAVVQLRPGVELSAAAARELAVTSDPRRRAFPRVMPPPVTGRRRFISNTFRLVPV